MACFLVPAAEAVAATIAAKVIEKKEPEAASDEAKIADGGKLPFSKKLRWLTNLLWGGSALLAFEHVWHGEVVPWYPFLTAAGDPADAAEMLHEMGTVGVTMAALVTAVWLVMLAASSAMERRAPAPELSREAE